MTSDILTVVGNEIIGTVKDKLLLNHIHHVPVISGKKIVGIISLSDIHRMEDHFTIFNAKTSEEIKKSSVPSAAASMLIISRRGSV